MKKAITLILSVALLGIFAAVVVAAMEPSDGPSTVPASSTEERTDTGVDISGPCDEAEHASDPRCAGVQRAPQSKPAPAPQGGGVDISGPCDEAEHANDPRCTGTAVPGDDAGRVDNSGPGSVNSGDDDALDDHGGDDFDDDSSGSGHGGGDNSGHGGGDD